MKPRIQHVSIPRPPDSDAATRAFYGDLLELQEVPPPKALDGLGLIWYDLGGIELHCFTEEPSGEDRSGRHLCLQVEDVDALRARLQDAGITVVGDIPIPGRPRYFLRDPFGNRIEITTIEADYRELECAAS